MKRLIMIGTTAACFYGFRAHLIKELVEKNVKVYAFTTDHQVSELEKIEKLGAIPVVYSLSRSSLNPLSDLYATYKLYKQIKELEPDLVFSYFTKPVIYGSLAAKLSKVKKITAMLEGLGSPFTVHRHGQSLKIKLIRFIQVSLYRIVFPFIDKIVFLNKDDPVDLIENNKIKHKANSSVVLGPIGLNLKDYSYTPWNISNEISFIFIARLLAEKGIFEYVEAAKIVKKKYPHIIFRVIGGLDLENPYGLTQNQLDELIESNTIEYSGFVTNVDDYIKKSAVFVLPSYYREGVPRSTQEAMAIGRPVITTDVPGCRDTVIDGVNGFLVPKWNPQALAEKMIYFIEHPEQVRMMGDQSHKIAIEKFDAEKVNQRLLEILGI
ncbi:group 1 glycosyl transferase [Acinetobacter sp. HA]|uniref:glycosyltransferase family 4 protein n=1 Tax=Acinetobacter sp. HA TaxID=1173062 RepID=UPI000263DD04|nr:glycosyltransferase family 4 protein [Acinetobacter sp. HA]EIM38202.1 group 1 glycosyl transferase [Acinetobacter sp. HA]EIM38376.1 group 1 glycosyl transferase [Acinetobacter sp. HA]